MMTAVRVTARAWMLGGFVAIALALTGCASSWSGNAPQDTQSAADGGSDILGADV